MKIDRKKDVSAIKVLFVMSIGFDAPGPSIHLVKTMIEETLKEGFDVHIIEKHTTGQNSDIPSTLSQYKNITYDIVPIKQVKKNHFFRRYLTDIKYTFSSFKYYKKHKDVDVVFVQSCNIAFFPILLLKLFLKKPIVYNVQDIWPINALQVGILNEKSIVYKGLRILQKNAYKMSDKIITISEDMKKTLIEENVADDKIEVIHNWSYSDEYYQIVNSDNKFIKINNIDIVKYKVVYAGNIGAVQNVDIIIKAAEILKEEAGIHFHIIGDGVQKNKYLEYVKNYEIDNITFYPMQSPEIAPHVYAMADINVIPLCRGIVRTALPSKTAICLSCGKPIIACVDTESEYGKLIGSCDKCSVISTNDPNALAECIRQYYNQNICGYSKDTQAVFSKYFSKQNNAKKYVQIMNHIAKGKKIL
jgi:colanic acid biosynthesis glycosyl transferase WcaI